MTLEDKIWLEGRISIEAAIQGGNRPVHAVYVRQGKWDRSLQGFMRRVGAAGIPLEMVDAAFIEARVSGNSHGGVLADVGLRQTVSLESLVVGEGVAFVVMLDGIEDPFNFGQAVRALYAAGVTGIVVRPRNWTTAAGVVARASAGASELVPLAMADSAEIAAKTMRAHGLLVACTSREDAVSIYEADLTQPLFMLIGGERRGITRSFLNQADLRLEIPYGRDQFKQSLGAATSAAILGFELMRQRGVTR